MGAERACEDRMTLPGVILRGSPPPSEWSPPGPEACGRSLTQQLGLFLFAGGRAGAAGDEFGLGAVLIARGRLLFHALLLVPDDIDPTTRASVEAWAAANPIHTVRGPAPWRVVTVSEFFDPQATRAGEPWAFVPNAYSGRGPVVGADLLRTFGLVAEQVVARRGRNLGSWEAWLPGWGRARPERRDVTKVSPNRPPLRVRARRVGASVEFGPTEKAYGKHRWRGEFVDLLSLAYALDADRAAGFVEHARHFGLTAGEPPIAVPLTAEGAAAVATAALDLHRLTRALDRAAGGWLTGPADRAQDTHRLPPDRLQSPASLADHLLRRFRVSPPLRTFDLTEAEHRAWCEAFHGGWCDADPRLRAMPFEALALDLSSAYPLVAHRLGWWEVVTAERLGRRSVTRELRRFLRRVARDPRAALDPAAWERFGLTVVKVVPDGEPFVVSVDDEQRPDGRTEVVPVRTVGRSLFYAWPDVVAATVLSGRVPNVVRAVRFVPAGRQGGLRHRVPVCPGLLLPAGTDPVLGLVCRRRKARAAGDEPLAALLHAMTNGLVSGNPSRFDDQWRKVGRRWMLQERLGPWSFMPLAVTVTAGARLLLAVLDRLVRELGGTVAYRDTDSSIVPASPEGGTLTLTDGSTIRQLRWSEVETVLAPFDWLSPDPAWPVWKVVRGSGARPLRAVVFGPKRHAGYLIGSDGPELIDWTEAGLGGMWADPAAMEGRCAEGGRAWSKAAVEREVAYAEAKLADPDRAVRQPVPWDAPAALPFPTVRRLQVTRPELAASLPAALGTHLGSRYLEAVVDDRGLRRQAVRSVVALDPGGPLDSWHTLRWLDRRTGEPVRVTTDPMDLDAVLVESLATRAGDYGAPPRSAPPAEVVVTPLSVRYRGRVSGVLDGAEAGITDDLVRLRPAYEDGHGLGPGQREALIALAQELSHAEFARRARTTPRVSKRIGDDRLPAPTATRRILAALREADTGDYASGCGCGCGQPVPVGRRSYVDDCHRERAKKRRRRRSGALP